MDDLPQTPQWLATALVGAVIAAVGYVAKLLLEWSAGIRNRNRERRARLIELHSLLRASNAAFRVQCEDRDRLQQLIKERLPELAATVNGYEKLFAAAFPQMSDQEKELHLIVRSITENTLFPLNQAVLDWLKKDDYFKTRANRGGQVGRLAKRLEDLEVHLLLWQAKFKVWIPDKQHHALVYMGDEERHGVEFPRGIESDVEQALKTRNWLGA